MLRARTTDNALAQRCPPVRSPSRRRRLQSSSGFRNSARRVRLRCTTAPFCSAHVRSRRPERLRRVSHGDTATPGIPAKRSTLTSRSKMLVCHRPPASAAAVPCTYTIRLTSSRSTTHREPVVIVSRGQERRPYHSRRAPLRPEWLELRRHPQYLAPGLRRAGEDDLVGTCALDGRDCQRRETRLGDMQETLRQTCSWPEQMRRAVGYGSAPRSPGFQTTALPAARACNVCTPARKSG